MRVDLIVRILVYIAIYLGLKYFGGPIGDKILYPITLLVTFLHEFGHAIGALLTGGSVDAIQINADGSGFTITRGGWRPIVLMFGYLGSAVLGNLLFYIGAKKEYLTSITLYLLAGIMLFTGVFWSNSIFSTVVLLIFAASIIFVVRKTKIGRELLMFFGLATIIYIIQDFNVGPRSDLEMYARLFILIPSTIWMYIWLFIALFLLFWNLRLIFKKE